MLFLDGGDVVLNLEAKETKANVRWYDVEKGGWKKSKIAIAPETIIASEDARQRPVGGQDQMN